MRTEPVTLDTKCKTLFTLQQLSSFFIQLLELFVRLLFVIEILEFVRLKWSEILTPDCVLGESLIWYHITRDTTLYEANRMNTKYAECYRKCTFGHYMSKDGLRVR